MPPAAGKGCYLRLGESLLVILPLMAAKCLYVWHPYPSEARSCEASLLSITPQSKALCPPSPALLLSMSTGTIHRGTLSQGGPERGMEDLAGSTSRSVCGTRLGLSKQLRAVLGTARRDINDLTG